MHFWEDSKIWCRRCIRKRAPIEKREKRRAREEKQDTDTAQQQRFSPPTVSLGAVWVKQYTVSLTVLLNKDWKDRQRCSGGQARCLWLMDLLGFCHISSLILLPYSTGTWMCLNINELLMFHCCTHRHTESPG